MGRRAEPRAPENLLKRLVLRRRLAARGFVLLLPWGFPREVVEEQYAENDQNIDQQIG